METDRERRNAARRKRYHEMLALETPEEKEERFSKKRDQYERRKSKSGLSETSTPQQTDPNNIIVSGLAIDRETRNSARRKRYHEILALETPEEKELRLSKQREQYKRRKSKSTQVDTSTPQQTEHASNFLTSVVIGSHATKTLGLQGSPKHYQDCAEVPNQDSCPVQHQNTGGSFAKRDVSNARRREIYWSQREAKKSGSGLILTAVAKKKKHEFGSLNTPHNLDLHEKTCGHCGALAWSAEQTTRQRQTNAWGLTLCCGEGKVELPMLRETPSELRGLLDSGDTASTSLRLNIRAYNTIFAFTSMGSTPKFAQLYMFDANADISGRINVFSEECQLDPVIVGMLQRLFDRENAMAKMFHEARDRFSENDYMPCFRKMKVSATNLYCSDCDGFPEEYAQRFKVLARARDPSGEATFVLFNTDTERLRGLSVDQIMRDYKECNSINSIPPILRNLQGMSHIFQLKITSYNTNNSTEQFTLPT